MLNSRLVYTENIYEDQFYAKSSIWTHSSKLDCFLCRKHRVVHNSMELGSFKMQYEEEARRQD